MKRLLLSLLILSALAMLLCAPALAESYTFDAIKATIEIDGEYVILTPDNLKSYEDWLQTRDTTLEDEQKDFESRGVLLQVWATSLDSCFEITARQTEKSEAIFDANEQDETVRRAYRLGFYPDNDYEAEGYTYTASDWKKTAQGRFLILKYTYRDNSEIVYRALGRRTIRNGYEIDLSMKVYGRAIKNTDNTTLNKLWDKFKFTQILPMTPQASAKMNLTVTPPAETCENKFTIEGTAAPGLELTAVAMGLNSPNPAVFTYTVGKNGKIKMPITLPKEGVFLLTLTGKINGADALEIAYPVTYQRTLLAVDIKTEIPEVVTADTLRISGTSLPGASIQLLVNGSNTKKKVAANTKWYVDIDTSQEGTYDVVLVFSKKGLEDRRFTYSFTRQWSNADMLKHLKKSAIKPSYANLVKKNDQYLDKIVGYKAYVMGISEAGSEWMIQMALTKKNDLYYNIIIVSSTEQPTVRQGERVTMYGKSVGMTVPENDEDGKEGQAYPCFELVIFESIE